MFVVLTSQGCIHLLAFPGSFNTTHIVVSGWLNFLRFWLSHLSPEFQLLTWFTGGVLVWHMEKQEMEMETEMETEMENWNGNSCMVVSNHWTGLLDLPILPLLVRAEAKRAYYLSFLESV